MTEETSAPEKSPSLAQLPDRLEGNEGQPEAEAGSPPQVATVGAFNAPPVLLF
jgi:hypothetical protein